MTQATFKCKANDPSNCRYHRPNAGVIAFQNMKDAEHAVSVAQRKAIASNLSEDADALISRKVELDAARDAYHATPDGIVDLTNQFENAATEEERSHLEYKLDVATYHAEELEKQNAIDDAAGGALIPLQKSTYEIAENFTKNADDSSWPVFTGAKYDSNLSVSEIKSSVTSDIKEAQRKNYLPRHLDFRVTVNSGSRSLYIHVRGASDQQLFEPENNNGYTPLTLQAKELEQRIGNIANAYKQYQYDEVEARTNTTNYWSEVHFESQWDKEARLRRHHQLKQRRTQTR